MGVQSCLMLAIWFSLVAAAPTIKPGGVGNHVPSVPIPAARKDGLKKSGAPAPNELQPGELSKKRDTMRKAWCAGGAHATAVPCTVAAHLAKVKGETDPAKKKALMEARAK